MLPRSDRDHAIDEWFDHFPRLSERRNQSAGSLSGGEQQMLAVARALVSRPKVVLLDEPSLGLAPLMVAEVFSKLSEINREIGTAMLLVEQNAVASLEVASRAYVLEAGRVTRTGTAHEFQNDDNVRRAYLGI